MRPESAYELDAALILFLCMCVIIVARSRQVCIYVVEALLVL
jgi:hypothetical protein